MEQIQEFGKYLLLDHIADGGMATIHRARFLNKIIIIKMIKKNFSEDSNYKSMFIDEIKNTFTLMHPNIAQIFDYGERNKKLYCAMEFVDGKNLKEYFDKCQASAMDFPLDIALHIVIEVCAGLSYTHQFIDKFTGEKPNMIHRDISPNNIMISHDGSVKIIDFGIAKAKTNVQSTTQVGTIKCNTAYAGPEYVNGDKLDHRYDQFSLAVVLWELLTGKRLFAAEDAILTLKNVQTCEVDAPSKFNKQVTEELDRILLKALSKDPNQRFKNIEQFSRALTKELNRLYLGFNPTDLKYFANYLFKEEIKKDHERYGELFTQSNQFKFIQETKSHDVKAINNNNENSKHQSFKLTTKIKKLKLFYMLGFSLLLGFIIGEQFIKRVLRSWLFGE